MIDRFFGSLGRTVVKHPVAVMTCYVLLAVLSVWGTVTCLQLKTEQNELVGADLEYNKRYLNFLREFGDLEFLYVVIQVGDDPARAMEAADTVAHEISMLTQEREGSPRRVESVFDRVPPEALRFGLPFKDYEELKDLSSWMGHYRKEIGELAAVDRFDGLFALFARTLRPGLLNDKTDDGTESGTEFARWGFRLLDLTVSSVEGVVRGDKPRGFRRQLEDDLGLSPRERGYIATDNNKLLLVEVVPVKDESTLEVIRESLSAVREVLDRVRLQFPDVEIGLTGRPVLQADEMMTTERDMRFATIIALGCVLVLFVLAFRRLRRPLFSVLTLALSIVLTLGVVTATIGYLTLLSVVFTAMLVGLGIDFGIHFVARYQDELLERDDVGEAICRSLETTGRSIGMGAVTTAAAFFTILLVDFQGLRELGFIAGVGVLICFVSMVTFLPALILVADRHSAKRRRLHPPRPVRVPFIAHLARHPRLTLATFGVLSVLGCGMIRGLPYNSNLIELQAQELESVKYERLVIEESNFSTWFCAFIVDSQAAVGETLARLEKAKEAGILGDTESILDYIPADQERKRLVFAEAWSAVEQVEFSQPSAEVDAAALSESLDGLLDSLDDLASLSLQRGNVDAAGELDGLTRRVEGLTDLLASADVAATAALGTFQAGWLGDLHSLLGGLRDSLRPTELRPGDLPYVLRRRLTSTDGSRYLVYAFPSRDIWQDRNMEEFVAAMREVDPKVTGAPIQVYESSWRMHRGFLLAAVYSICVTLVFLFLDLRNLRDTILAMVPVLVGLLWLLEVLPVLGLTFNLANFFALPILIGAGIDGGVHIVHRFRETGSAVKVLTTTCSAVTLSFLTTMAGFGAMVFASHRGIRSLGEMMVAGLTCVLIASVVLLPALLQLVEKRIVRDREKTMV